ncbi:MAG: TIGR00296 family protein [Candidatus Aminicenantia bacterium]
MDENQKIELLKIARNSIEEYLKNKKFISPETTDLQIKEKKGVFVTLKVKGDLRGCIGYPLPYKPLFSAVAELAIESATGDPRFPPIRIEELEDMEIEISVLTIPKPISSYEKIQIGRHGIIVSKGPFKGVLLPQVPVEYKWNLEDYLSHGCLKAGLPADEWKRGVKIEVFEAEIFSEKELGLR